MVIWLTTDIWQQSLTFFQCSTHQEHGDFGGSLQPSVIAPCQSWLLLAANGFNSKSVTAVLTVFSARILETTSLYALKRSSYIVRADDSSLCVDSVRDRWCQQWSTWSNSVSTERALSTAIRIFCPLTGIEWDNHLICTRHGESELRTLSGTHLANAVGA